MQRNDIRSLPSLRQKQHRNATRFEACLRRGRGNDATQRETLVTASKGGFVGQFFRELLPRPHFPRGTQKACQHRKLAKRAFIEAEATRQKCTMWWTEQCFQSSICAAKTWADWAPKIEHQAETSLVCRPDWDRRLGWHHFQRAATERRLPANL